MRNMEVSSNYSTYLIAINNRTKTPNKNPRGGKTLELARKYGASYSQSHKYSDMGCKWLNQIPTMCVRVRVICAATCCTS